MPRTMLKPVLADQWMAQFPGLARMDPAHLQRARLALSFKHLAEGEVAYRQGASCPAYVMCLEGRTRIFKASETGREILLYRVGPGETCVLTTSCLLAGRSFPAESVAEVPVTLAAIPAQVFHELMQVSQPFRQFVLDNYGQLMSSLITLVDEVAFTSLDLRLARKLLAEADATGTVSTTHQQLALDLGSVREVISRYLREWERKGWIRTSRGAIEVADRRALARYGEEP
jgi:CRP/FNR family transcriptional regulator, anaerobic regulatory protein